MEKSNFRFNQSNLNLLTVALAVGVVALGIPKMTQSPEECDVKFNLPSTWAACPAVESYHFGRDKVSEL
jgi:hypothetical protein